LRRYSCYDFGEYEHVPDAWHLTRNRTFNHGNVAVWNTGAFRSAFSGMNCALPGFVKFDTES